MTSKRTTELRPGERATSPDGTRSGIVRRLHPGGIAGGEADVTTVQFQNQSVHPTDPTLAYSQLPVPRSWVLNAPDDAQWELGSNEPLTSR